MGQYFFSVLLFTIMQAHVSKSATIYEEYFNGQSQHYTSVPNQLFHPNVTRIDLSSNRITINSSIDFAGFPYLGSIALKDNLLSEVPLLPNLASSLTSLDVSFNRITSINTIALEILPNLNIITLTNNFLTDFPDFLHPQLCNININNNQLTKLPFLPSLSKQISTLEVGGNVLRSLDMSTLASYPKLSNLVINNNSLTTFPNLCATFRYYNIRAYGNPWICDCRLRWMLTAKSITKNSLYPKITCASPSNLAGKDLRFLSPNQLTCSG